MIESITLKEAASYDATGVQINDLKKVNFFFGFNGSGKSTIAKYFYNLGLEPNNRVDQFNNCSQNGFDQTNHQILTFDENFTEINFNKNPTLKGVFSLNETNDVIDRQITKEEILINFFKEQKEKKNKLIKAIGDDNSKKETSLLESCWTLRNTFSTFTKITIPYSGSKPNHLQKLNQLLVSPLLNVPSIQQLKDKYDLLYEREISEISIKLNAKLYRKIRIIETNLNNLLQEIIIGNEDVDIAALVKSINSRSWVETGVKYLEQTDSTCPFCQKETIDEELRKQFDEFFDETYKGKIEILENLLAQYKEKSNAFLANTLSIQNVYNPNNLVSETYLQLQELFRINISIIEDKIDNANEKKNINSLLDLKPVLSTIIKSIRENNIIFSELDKNRKDLMSDIWLFIADKSKASIEIFTKKEAKYSRIIASAKDLIKNYSSKILVSKGAIELLRNQTINTKEAVDNINLILRNSGFESFEIAEKEVVNNIAQYYLKRPNSTDENPIFKSLSEGEKSFISFLYFYQLCIGTDDIRNNGTKKKIIVIDDPVSSLDSQALFVISTLIHNLILQKGKTPKSDLKLFKNENIAQVFVLTHNLYFYKEVSFNRRPICTDYWHYRVSKTDNKTSIIGQRDKTISDDYSLLWQTIKDLKLNLPQNSSLNVVIANSMRRIIESYVSFLGIGNDSWSAVLNENIEQPEYYIKCSFISTINDESHKITALDGIYFQKISNEQPQVLFNVFKEIFKSIGKEHYEMMMGEEITEAVEALVHPSLN
jgi:wobble nucleotide-excising tRNase